MPKKTTQSVANTCEVNFHDNIKEWVKITNHIIEYEEKLRTLREQQMVISRKCVDNTGNLDDGTHITTLQTTSKPQPVETVDISTNIVTTVSKPQRRKRRTKAQIEKEKADSQEKDKKVSVKEETNKSPQTKGKKNTSVKKKPEVNKNNVKKSSQKNEIKSTKPDSNMLEENSDDLSSSESSDMSSSESSTELDSLSSDSSSGSESEESGEETGKNK